MNLDEKDKEILALLKDGKRPPDIAKAVYLSPRTVEYRLAKARVKNNCKTVYELLAKYVTFVL